MVVQNLVLGRCLSVLRLGSCLRLHNVLVKERDGRRPREERVGNLNLKGLRIGRRLRLLDGSHHGSLLRVFKLVIHKCVGAVALRLGVLAVLLRELVPGLLQLLVAEIQCLDEGEGLFGAAVPGEGVQDFWELGFADDGVLHFADVLICQDDVALVHTKLKWQEVDVKRGRLALSDFDLLILEGEWLWDEQVLRSLLHRGLVLGAFLASVLCLGVLLGLRLHLVLLVLDLDVEQHLLLKRVVNRQLHSRRLVQLRSDLAHVDRVALVHV